MGTDVATLGEDWTSEEFDERCRGWLRAMARGDERALAELYDATLPKAFGVAVRIVNDAALAEDVVVEAFHEAWQHAASFDESRGRPITWLLTICRNRALDEYRRRASATRRADAAAAMVAPDEGDGPDELLAATEAGHVVHELLRTLSPDDRQLVAMAYFRGFSHRQIADTVQMPLGTVKTRIRRALKSLEAAVPAGIR